MWEVEFTDEFFQWWDTLDEDEQDSLSVDVEMLQRIGQTFPGLMRIR
jgi:hypothetical protein